MGGGDGGFQGYSMALIFRMNNCSPSTHNKVGEMCETTVGKREMERVNRQKIHHQTKYKMIIVRL